MHDFGYLNVSRETYDQLRKFEALVRQWTPKVNLISQNSVSDLWERHIVDSLQIMDIPCDAKAWADFGSGGGFPGLVIAIALKQSVPNAQVTLVESDKRKCAFLRMVIRELDLNARVLTDRIEKIEPLQATALSARALASLDKLLGFADLHLAETGTAIFPKGSTWRNEVDAAKLNWTFDLETRPSQTNPEAAILIIKNIRKR